MINIDDLITAMNCAYSYEDDDNSIPTISFCDDLATFWEPFAERVMEWLEILNPDIQVEKR